jgi:hypothetical protein
MVSSLIGVGIILSFYGNQVIFEDLTKGEGQVKSGENLTIIAELDNAKNGIYAVQIIDFKKGIIIAKILDPTDTEIESQSIDKEVYEGKFDVTGSGIYKLIIESADEKEIKIFGVIGPEPDSGKKSLGFISLYILVIGLIGMVGVAIYAIKNHKRAIN